MSLTVQNLSFSYGQHAVLDAEFVVVTEGIAIPYMYTIVYQILDIGITAQKPQQLIYHTLQKELFCSHKREALAKVEAHLVAKDTLCTCTCSVTTYHALAANLIE